MQQDTDSAARPEQPPDSNFGINRVGIRVPPFWPEKPSVVRAAGGSVCIIEHYAGRDEILLLSRNWITTMQRRWRMS
jgi:hypothetical protein